MPLPRRRHCSNFFDRASSKVLPWLGDALAGALMLGVEKTGTRNRSIFAAYIAGRAINELAKQYGLTDARIIAILSSERHRIAVSPDPVYCELRERFERAIWLKPHKHALVP
jgi:hypothetical protein